MTLKKFICSYNDNDTPPSESWVFECMAEDEAHAIEQCQNAYPSAFVADAYLADDQPDCQPFDNYEIHGCAECTNEGETESFIEQCPDGEADFWTLYGHLPEGGVQAIGDFTTREDAEATFQRITGIPFGSHDEIAARARLMQAAGKLLAACEGILASFHESVTTKESLAGFPALAAVAEAIAHATGRAA